MTWLLNALDAVRFRLRHGRWCDHDDWSLWILYDHGRAKYRQCRSCGRWESTR